MSNYIIEDETDDYEENIITPNNKIKIIIWSAVSFIVLIFIVVILKGINTNKGIESYEKSMVKSAEKYVKNNNIAASREMYIDVSKLDITLPNTCNLLSGVIYDGVKYTPYLLCNDYESKIVINKPGDNALNGDEVIILLKDMEYYELGYSGNTKMTINSNISSEEGVYNVYYVSDEEQVLTRKVIVVDNENLGNSFPKINIVNDDPIILEKGNNYDEATALDAIDGDISDKIVKYGYFDINTPGEYKIIYSVENSLGYTTTIMKNIIVVNSLDNGDNFEIIVSLSNENMTNHNIKASVNIVGNDFSYSILPDGTKVNAPSYKYTIKENGDYEFTAVSKNGIETKKVIKVSNIDRTLPEGTCKASIYGSKTSVSVNITSFNSINGYDYYVNGNRSGYVETSSYTMVGKAREAYVMVKDYIGNEAKIMCDIENNDPTVGNPRVKYFSYNNDEYVIANTPNNLAYFVSLTCRKISQSNDTTNCGDACLSFATYYAAYIQKGNLSNMNMYDACNYNYTNVARFQILNMPTKQAALSYIYDEINRGQVLVLQVTGTTARASRHFITVVGYLRSKYSKEELREEDLLAIDSWTGCFTTISYTDLSKRTMYDNNDGYGYRIDAFRN